MSDFHIEPVDPDEVQTVEDTAENVREDIRLGHVEDDVSHVLRQRLDEAGMHVRADVIDDLAEEIENDASR